jgi:DUF4097 and DUF4098 domain-containing protein YvlB
MQRGFRLLAWAGGAAWLLALPAPVFAHHIEKHFPVSDKAVVIVHNPNGLITIRSWPKQEVMVVADHASGKVEVNAVQNGNRIELLTRPFSNNVSPSELRADYEVSVPENAELHIHNDSGTVAVTDVMGDTTVETVAAGVQLENAGGYLTISTVGGSFDCMRCYGRVDAHSISGNLRVFENRSTNVHFQTGTGSIFFQGDFLPNGMYSLKNYSGPIEVRYSQATSFDLSATSIQGRVINDAKLKPPKHSSNLGPRYSRSLFGTYNEGLAKVELSSFSGTISIRKRD